MGIRELFGMSSGASTDTLSIVCRTRGNSGEILLKQRIIMRKGQILESSS